MGSLVAAMRQFESFALINFSDPVNFSHLGQISRTNPLSIVALGDKQFPLSLHVN